jgi:hypothetical protein
MGYVKGYGMPVIYTKKFIRKDLARRFRNLPPRMQANLRWHVENGTEILCGGNAATYLDGDGSA